MSRVNVSKTIMIATLMLGAMGAYAQETDPHAGHQMTPAPAPGSAPPTSSPPAADPHAGHTMPATPAPAPSGDHAQHGGAPSSGAESPAAMDHGSMQGGSAPPDARDPHAYSGGYDFGPYQLHMMGEEHRILSVLFDRLEAVRSDDNSENAYDVEAWYGYSYNRAVIKAEGETDAGRLQEGRTEVLWGHAIAPYWDTQLGLRYDSGVGPNRSWLAFGVQGLAPYWFELEATAYLGEDGRAALRVDAEYEVLFTQRLILQPRVEANWYSKDDSERDLGSGITGASAGVRLRYEIRREFAPYIGIERAMKFGETADIARAAGADTNETRVVAGVRLWF